VRSSRRLRSLCAFGLVAPLASLALAPAVAANFVSVGAGGVPDQMQRAVIASPLATPAYTRFLATYWNGRAGLFYARSDHATRDAGGRYADFWWTAQLWETVMDAYSHTGAATERAMIDDVYDGFVAHHPTFASDYNDDRGWWALAATRAYRLTGEQRYLDRAKRLFAGIWGSWDGSLGGGLWWRRSVHDQKNVATNGVAAMTAAALYELTHVAAYRSRAAALVGWIDGHLRSGSRIDDHLDARGHRVTWQFTYDYGLYVGASGDLYRMTGSRTYLARAVAAVDRALDTLAPDGVLRDEGPGDGGGFKGVFVRNLDRIADLAGTPAYRTFLRRNAASAAASRRTDGLNGTSWSTIPSSRSAIESLTDASAVALFEIVAARR
jgi:predicted alpha-1,6-mannanase (GH76 family)